MSAFEVLFLILALNLNRTTVIVTKNLYIVTYIYTFFITIRTTHIRIFIYFLLLLEPHYVTIRSLSLVLLRMASLFLSLWLVFGEGLS